MSLLRLIGLKLTILAISLYYGFVTIIDAISSWYKYGSDYYTVKHRPNPPSCLRDPIYGTHKFLQLKDVKLHYVENGDHKQPLMLFVHGFPEFWLSWRHQLKYFSKSHWVVAIDMRGYGESDKPSGMSKYKLSILEKDIADVVVGLGREKCILVGHDWGGAIAFNTAANYPNFVEKLIVLNGPIWFTMPKAFRTSWDQFRKSWYMFYFQLPFLPEFLLRNTKDMDLFRLKFRNSIGEPIATDEELEAYKFTFGHKGAWTPPLNYYRSIFRSNKIASKKYLKIPTIKCPTLVIWGENDHALSTELAEMTREHVENVKIVYVKKGSHFIQNDKPDIVNSIIKEFL